jgi:hypothetical protein
VPAGSRAAQAGGGSPAQLTTVGCSSRTASSRSAASVEAVIAAGVAASTPRAASTATTVASGTRTSSVGEGAYTVATPCSSARRARPIQTPGGSVPTAGPGAVGSLVRGADSASGGSLVSGAASASGGSLVSGAAKDIVAEAGAVREQAGTAGAHSARRLEG